MSQPTTPYLAALRYPWLTGLYDPLVRLSMREATFKRHLVTQARLQPGHRVLDLGCGTATLTLLIQAQCPTASVVGVDGETGVLALAQRKVQRAKLPVTLHQALVTALPYPDASFDHVFSTLLFHHLTPEQKLLALRETRRVLRPGGELHLADFDSPQNSLLRLTFLLVQLLDGFATTRDHARGQLPHLIAGSGFETVHCHARIAILFGTLACYSARKPASSDTPANVRRSYLP